MRKEKFDMDVVNNFFEHDYHDRGMVKWQGFMLSDHTAALKKQKPKEVQQQIIEPKPQQTTEVITSTLAKAYHRKRTVTIQLNELDVNGNQTPDLKTHVLGYQDEMIILDNKKSISIDDIRHIEFN